MHMRIIGAECISPQRTLLLPCVVEIYLVYNVNLCVQYIIVGLPFMKSLG